MKREWVYVHIAECGAVLYVGRTSNPETRHSAHRSHSKRALNGKQRISRWWPVVHRIEWVQCRGRAAWVVEEELIERLNPVFNRASRGLGYSHSARFERAVQAARVTELGDRDVALLARLGRRSPAHLTDVFAGLERVGAAA